MTIYTTSFSRIGRLPDSIVPISICGRAAAWYQGLQYKVLAPKYWFFARYQKNRNKKEFTRHFNADVLASLSADNVVGHLAVLSGGKDVALICHEEPDAFCHWHLVANWLTKNGYPAQEWQE